MRVLRGPDARDERTDHQRGVLLLRQVPRSPNNEVTHMKTAEALVFLLISSCFEFPTDADDCIRVCAAIDQACQIEAKTCFDACPDLDLPCAEGCYLESMQCSVESKMCIAACVEYVEKSLK